MGIPVRSIKSFEDGIRWRSNNDWTLIILANAHSDSRAVKFVIENFHIMDTLSRDVDFYMPGYRLDASSFERMAMNESWYLEQETVEFDDSHIDRMHSDVIISPRLGRISFNDAEFADFVLELTRRKRGYAYWGYCQMILLPITKQRKPDYNTAVVFDLDNIIDTPNGPSLDAFFHNTFNIIRMRPHNTTLERFFLGKNIFVIKEVTKLYQEATSNGSDHARYEIVIHNVLLDMERCLKWSLQEEYFFISYSSRNIMMATMLRDLMQQHGLYVWMAPDGIPQGREYSLIIPTALRFAKSFVLLLTPESANSRWVKRELDIAISNETNTKVRVLLAGGYTVDDIRKDHELNFFLNRVQVKYDYNYVICDESFFNRFITE